MPVLALVSTAESQGEAGDFTCVSGHRGSVVFSSKRFNVQRSLCRSVLAYIHIYTHTRTHIYTHSCVCVCVHVFL